MKRHSGTPPKNMESVCAPLSYRIVEDFQTAEECENDTYAAAWNTIPPHRPKEHLYAFLARITRHIS